MNVIIPNHDPSEFSRGVDYLNDAQHAKALQVFQGLLDKGQQAPEIYHNCGVAAQELGHGAQAKQYYQFGLQQSYRFAPLWYSLGTISHDWPQRACYYYLQTIRFDLTHRDALYNLIILYLNLGRYRSIAWLLKRNYPADPPDYLIRAKASYLTMLGQYQETVTCLHQLQHRQSHDDLQLGQLHLELNQPVLAKKYLHPLITSPELSSLALALLGECYLLLRQYQQAREYLLQAYSKGYRQANFLANLLKAHYYTGHWQQWQTLQVSLEQYILEQQELEISNPFEFLALLTSSKALLKVHQAYALRFSQSFRKIELKNQAKGRCGLRVGFLTADCYSHPVGLMLASLLAHRSDSISYYGFSLMPDSQSDKVTKEIKHNLEFVDLHAIDVVRAALIISSYSLDILIDLGGYTTGSKVQILAQRVAPIQCHYLGYPASLGANFIDYLITNEAAVPKDLAHNYQEKLAYLPEALCALEPKYLHKSQLKRSDYGLSAEQIVFACFSGNYRICPKTFILWMKLLRACPNSVLWLQDCGQTKELYQQQAALQGVDKARIVMLKQQRLSAHLPQQLADLYLEPLAMASGTANLFNAYVGLPVVALVNDYSPTRTGGAVLAQAPGILHIVSNEQEYLEKALLLANAIAAGRGDVIQAQQSPLFRPKLLMQQLEALLQKISGKL